MSIMFIAPFGLQELAKTLKALSRQTVADQLELVFVVPASRADEPLPSGLEVFHSTQVVPLQVLAETGQGYVAGVRHAKAPLVVIGEDHSFPRPEWAQALIERHREGWAAVGAALDNGNPGSAVSWASFIINFSGATGVTSGPASYLASHQTSYKRDILLSLGDELPDLLGMEAILHERLAKMGQGLFLECKARSLHYNVEPWSKFFFEQRHAPQLYSDLRCQNWPIWRRWFYSAAAPLIWVLRCRRTLRHVADNDIERKLLPWVYLAILVGLAVATWGEVCGYLFGRGQAAERRFPNEFRRHLVVKSQELVV